MKYNIEKARVYFSLENDEDLQMMVDSIINHVENNYNNRHDLIDWVDGVQTCAIFEYTLTCKDFLELLEEPEITFNDVIQVAKQLNFNPTVSEMEEVINRYDGDSDPTATWNLIVENLLYEICETKK